MFIRCCKGEFVSIGGVWGWEVSGYKHPGGGSHSPCTHWSIACKYLIYMKTYLDGHGGTSLCIYPCGWLAVVWTACVNVWCLYVGIVTACPSQRSSLCIYWAAQNELHKEEMGLFTETFSIILGIKSLDPTDPKLTQITNIIVYQPASINCCFQPLWVEFWKLLSTSVFSAFSKWYAHITWLRGMEEYIT